MKTHVIRYALYTLFGILSLPNIATAGFVFDVNDPDDISDEVPGDSLCKAKGRKTCTLRAAIEEIDASSPQGSTCGVFEFPNRVILSPQTYTLAPWSEPFVIGRDDRDVCVHIQGASPQTTVINGGTLKDREGKPDDPRATGVFVIDQRGRLSLTDVTITRGHLHSPGGGAIWNHGGALAVYNSFFTDNSTHGRGGAIYTDNVGYTWIFQSTFSDNWSKPNTDIDFDGDRNPDFVAGGAIANIGGGMYLSNVTISRNYGGVDPRGDISGNGNDGGGVLNVSGGFISMNNATVAYNFTAGPRGPAGGGIYNDPISTFNIANSIIAKNFTGGDPVNKRDCRGTLESFGYNIVGYKPFDCIIHGGPGDQIGNLRYFNLTTGRLEDLPTIDPLLSDLSQHGGPTPTHALREGSPAIDVGNPDPGICAKFDQRHLARPKDGPTKDGYDGIALCDIGAYEHGAPEISVADVEVTEGNSGETQMAFEVRLSYPSVEPINFTYWVTDGTAKVGEDYYGLSGQTQFRPGNVWIKFYARALGDRVKEPDETLFFNVYPDITDLVRIKDGGAILQAKGTIKNDD